MSDQLTITGKFLGSLKPETVGQNGFLVRRFFLDNTTNADWPSTPEFKLKGDRVNLVDNLQKGQTISVNFNVQGTRYDNREKGGKQGVITELIAWRINVIFVQSAAATPPPVARQQPAPPPVSRPAAVPPVARPAAAPVAAAFQHMGEGDDDLPF